MKRVALEYLNKKQLGLVLAFSLLCGGCGGINIPSKVTKQQEKVAQDSELPSWYLNTPLNTGIFLYGSGEGESLEIAKSNALNNMAAGLIVTVSSTMKTSTNSSMSNGKELYSKDVSKDVKVEVDKIKFTNAVVKQTSLINKRFYVLMQVDRVELFSQKKGEFSSRDSRIDELYNSIEGKNKLTQIETLQNIYPMVKEAKSQAIVLNAINNDFAYPVYVKKYDNYIDKIDDIKSECVISVESGLKERYFVDVVIGMLNQNKFKIGTGNKNDISIKLNTQPKYSVSNGWNIAKVSTVISVVSGDKIVSNKTISTIGRSSTSVESALEDASRNFQEELESATLDRIIFGK
jgi:hypothetical protein